MDLRGYVPFPRLKQPFEIACFDAFLAKERNPNKAHLPATIRELREQGTSYFHLDIAEVQTEAGKLYLFVAIDRTSKFAVAELHERMNRTGAVEFLRHLVAAVPHPNPYDPDR